MISKEGVLVLIIMLILIVFIFKGCGFFGCHRMFFPGGYYYGRTGRGTIRDGSTGGRTYRGGGIGRGK